MLRVTNKWLPVLFVLALCLGAQGSKPEMLPRDPVIYINEGESLNLTCTSTEEIDFYFPQSHGFLHTSQQEPIQPYQDFDNKWRIDFRRAHTVYGDTGWYGCVVKGTNGNPGDYDDPNARWTYVYVKSNSSFFTEKIEDLQMQQATAGESIILGCRPTSPDYNVIIDKDGRGNPIYDPRFGVILKNLIVKDTGMYTCMITVDDTTEEIMYHLTVHANRPIKDLTISNETLRYVTRGDILRVNCTTETDDGPPYDFDWITPMKDERIQTELHKCNHPGKCNTSYELIINGVIDQDQGDYTCVFSTNKKHKNVTTHIDVHDPSIRWLNLTTHADPEISYKVVGDTNSWVQWVVSIDAHPEPKLEWLDPVGKRIEASWSDPSVPKHAIKTSLSSTTLRINRVDITDMGIYTLQASNAHEMKMINFTLKVLSRPMLTVTTSLEGFHLPKTNINYTGQVIAFPKPNVSCSFLETPEYPSQGDANLVSLKVEMDESDRPLASLFTFFTVFPVNTSGYVNCVACNTEGCDSLIDSILLSEVSSGFDIIQPSTILTVGDDASVTCVMSIYNVTSVQWFKDDDEPLNESQRVTVTANKTQFSYLSHLRIRDIRKSDNGSYYTCRGLSDGLPIYEIYRLAVYEPVVPVIVDTNMNSSELVVDLNTQGQTTDHSDVELKCRAKGTPPPTITWYKNENKIKCSKQFICQDNQTLVIKYLLDGDSGKYSCEARNRVGADSRYQTIVVKEKESPKTWIYLAAALFVISVAGAIYFMLKIRREKAMRKQLMEAGLTHFEEGALECLNPDLTVDDQAELLPYQQKWEFPRERLDIGKQLGSGAFGVVVKAKARGISDDEEVTTVAVKKVKHGTEATYIRALVSELKIMVHLGKHLNVVNLLGACTKNIAKRELLVIVEYCRFGNLQAYLRRHRNDFINQIDPTSGKIDPSLGFDILTRTTSTGSNNRSSGNSFNSNSGTDQVLYTAGTDPQSVSFSPDGCVLSNNSTQPGWRSNYTGDYKDQILKPICTQDLLSWAFQVARGMEYLSQRRVLHGDLAARNILLAENNIVKICDFGLAKTMYNDDNYKKKGDAPLPIKWMAIESIRDRVFSTQSDIWSFGIVLWEFFTLAETPYPGMEAEKQYQKLVEGYRMEKPEYATAEAYEIMLDCWNVKPTLRPSFTELVASIGDLLEESVKEHYVDLNTPYLDMNTRVLEDGKSDYLAMMSAPDYNALSSPISHYVNSPCLSPSGAQDDAYLAMSPSSPESESGIFSPGVMSRDGKFVFPVNDTTLNINTDSESEAVELSPMLSQNEDGYLKPLKFVERRAEFARQRQLALKNAPKLEKEPARDSGYCNIPQNLDPIDLKVGNEGDSKVDGIKRTGEKNSANETKGYVPSIIRTQDNYVNMPKQKNNLRIDAPASFSNPTYVITDNRQLEQAGI